MRQITVDKSELILALRENRKKHVETFNKAWEKYCDFAVNELRNRLEAAKEGKEFQTWWNLEIPENHTNDYDVALEMLEWHEDHNVNLTQNEFKNFVKDEWGWSEKFMTTSSSYIMSD